MSKEIEWVVTCSDGSEVYIWAANKPDAFMDAIERGYQPVSAELQVE